MGCLIVLVSEIMIKPQGKRLTVRINFRVTVKVAKTLLFDGLIEFLYFPVTLGGMPECRGYTEY